MRNKRLLLLCFLFFAFSGMDAALAAAEKPKMIGTEKDVKTDDSLFAPLKFNPNFKEKYKSGEFQYEVKATEKGVWERFKEWLVYWLRKIFGLSDGASHDILNIIFKVLATIIVLYVIYLIAKVILNKEGQWVFGKSTTKKVVTDEDIERNLQHVDFEKLLAATLQSGNQRLAIRYYYLWLLRKMSEKSIIDWNPEKTNSDYYYEIKNEGLRQDFSYVSYLYNYIWYGEFEITDTNFETIRDTFEKLLQSVR